MVICDDTPLLSKLNDMAYQIKLVLLQIRDFLLTQAHARCLWVKLPQICSLLVTLIFNIPFFDDFFNENFPHVDIDLVRFFHSHKTNYIHDKCVNTPKSTYHVVNTRKPIKTNMKPSLIIISLVFHPSSSNQSFFSYILLFND